MLNLYRVFQSIDGEISRWHQGRICTFVRFAGCSAKCSYCDTVYAQNPDSGTLISPEDLFSQVVEFGCSKVTITGGEPLEQETDMLLEFFDLLLKAGFKISVETNGCHRPIVYHPNISWVMDLKVPSAGGVAELMALENFLFLGKGDFVKVVVGNRNDFYNACSFYQSMRAMGSRVNFAFSPVFGKVEPGELVKWMQEKKLMDCILSYQIHKLIWPTVGVGEER